MINSKIGWTDHTVNLWHGCTEVSPGCDHCYARTLSERWGRDIWGNDKPRMEVKSWLTDLIKIQALAVKLKVKQRVFIQSMSDLFEKPMPLINSKGEAIVGINTGDLRDQLFGGIDTGEFPDIIFLFLTKRPSNINKYIPEAWLTKPPYNVMFGTSPVNQETYDKLIPQLLKVKGKRFLSIEPMLSRIDLTPPERRGGITNRGEWIEDIDWIIVGGESGNGARFMDPDWVREIRDRCDARTDMGRPWPLPFFFKQWGEYRPWENSDPESKRLWSTNDPLIKVGTKAAGNTLDGKQYLYLP